MRSYLFLLSLLGLLVACTPDPRPGPRIDFIGTSRFVSSDRLVGGPGDTLSTRIFVDVRDPTDGSQLQRLRITASYEPQARAFVYELPYDPGRAPRDSQVVYLDSVLTTNSFVYQFNFGTRTTSGRETWRFEITDNQDRRASRSFQLTVRNPDSLTSPFHEYRARLQAPQGARTLSYLDLGAGLLFPRVATRTNPDVQERIDLVYLPGVSNTPILATPTDDIAAEALGLKNWTRKNATTLKLTGLPPTGFTGATNEQAIITAFNSTPDSVTRTGPLILNQVYAFRTAAGQIGLLQVQELPTSARPSVNLQVRVTKQRP